MSAKMMNRRDLLRGSLTSMAGLAALGIPWSAMPALAQDETPVPFLDFPANFNANPGGGRRFLDTRTINNFITPTDQFYTSENVSLSPMSTVVGVVSQAAFG